MGQITRRELEEKFCSRLSDACLMGAVKDSDFDARALWEQRDQAYLRLAANGINIPILDFKSLKPIDSEIRQKHEDFIKELRERNAA